MKNFFYVFYNRLIFGSVEDSLRSFLSLLVSSFVDTYSSSMTANPTSESEDGWRDVSKSRPSLGVISSQGGLLEGHKKSRCIRSCLLYARSHKIQRYAIRGLCFVPLSRLWLSQQWRQPPWLISRNKHAGAQESNGLSFSLSLSLFFSLCRSVSTFGFVRLRPS